MVRISSAHAEIPRVDRVRGGRSQDRVNVPGAFFLGFRNSAARAADRCTRIRSSVYVDIVVVQLVCPGHTETGAFAGIIAWCYGHREGVASSSVNASGFAVRGSAWAWKPIPCHRTASYTQ